MRERECDTWRAVTLCWTAVVRASSVCPYRPLTCVPLAHQQLIGQMLPFCPSSITSFGNVLSSCTQQCSIIPQKTRILTYSAVNTYNPASVLMSLLHCFRCRVVLSQQCACRVAGAARTTGIIHIQPLI